MAQRKTRGFTETGEADPLARALTTPEPRLTRRCMSGYTDTSAYPDVPIGGRNFLQKPFTPDVLAARVREILDTPVRAPGNLPRLEVPHISRLDDLSTGRKKCVGCPR